MLSFIAGVITGMVAYWLIGYQSDDLCPTHQEPVYYDERDYTPRARCSVTGGLVSAEKAEQPHA